MLNGNENSGVRTSKNPLFHKSKKKTGKKKNGSNELFKNSGNNQRLTTIWELFL